MFCTMCLFLCSNSIFIVTTMKKLSERVLMREGANYEVYTFNIGIKNIMKYFIFIFFLAEITNPKKCRARYGLDRQHEWCKPCRYVLWELLGNSMLVCVNAIITCQLMNLKLASTFTYMAFIRRHFKQNSSEAPTPKKKERKSLTFSRGGRAGGLFGLWVRRSGSKTWLGKAQKISSLYVVFVYIIEDTVICIVLRCKHHYGRFSGKFY